MYDRDYPLLISIALKHPPIGGFTTTKLNQEQLSVLSSIVSENNDATLDELRRLLEQKTGVLIGRSTIDRMLRRLNLSLKKKHYIPHKKRVNEFNH